MTEVTLQTLEELYSKGNARPLPKDLEGAMVDFVSRESRVAEESIKKVFNDQQQYDQGILENRQTLLYVLDCLSIQFLDENQPKKALALAQLAVDCGRLIGSASVEARFLARSGTCLHELDWMVERLMNSIEQASAWQRSNEPVKEMRSLESAAALAALCNDARMDDLYKKAIEAAEALGDTEERDKIAYGWEQRKIMTKEKALSDPRALESYKKGEELMFVVEREQEAYEFFEEAIKYDSSLAEAYLGQGICLDKMSCDQATDQDKIAFETRAIEKIRKAQGLGLDDEFLHAALGLALFERGKGYIRLTQQAIDVTANTALAEEDFKAAVAVSPPGEVKEGAAGWLKRLNDISPSPGACFIATAVYGSPDVLEVEILRDFRDRVLLKSAVGEWLVKIYYSVSPPLADYLNKNKNVAAMVKRIFLQPVITHINKNHDRC